MTLRARAPLFLARPSRYAGFARSKARIALALLAAGLVLSWSALAAGEVRSGGDVQLYAGVVDAIRHGANYYETTAGALRLGGHPLRPFIAFRLPTLAVAQAWLPERIVPMLLFALAIGVALAWFERFREALRRPLPRVAALVLLAGGAVACWRPGFAAVPEVWAGLLIALSLARYRDGGYAEALGWALAAALIRETAALYLVVMAAFAWHERRGRETIAWGGALAVVALVLAVHSIAVAEVVTPADPASPGWVAALDPGLAIAQSALATALGLLPLALAAPLVVLAIAGWTALRDPLGTRVATTLIACAAWSTVAGRDDAAAGALLTAPVLLIGFAFVPDMLRDLTGSALDRRRIVVRRVTP